MHVANFGEWQIDTLQVCILAVGSCRHAENGTESQQAGCKIAIRKKEVQRMQTHVVLQEDVFLWCGCVIMMGDFAYKFSKEELFSFCT